MLKFLQIKLNGVKVLKKNDTYFTQNNKSRYFQIRQKAIQKMYMDSMTARQIAKIFNKAPATICGYLKQQNIPIQTGKRHLFEF